MKRPMFRWCGLLLALGAPLAASAQSESAPASAEAVPVMAPATMAGLPATSEPAAPVARKTRVAVPNMTATNTGDGELAKTLTQVLTIEVNKVAGIEAIGMADIEALLNHEQQKALLGCEDASCIAEIGGALGVDALLSSSIGRVGDTTVLSIQLNDTHSARKIGGAYETVAGKPDALIAVLQRKVPEVMRGAQPQWALAEAAAAQPSDAPVEPAASGFQVVWPAIGVMGAGVVALAVAAGLGGVSLAIASNANDNPRKLDGTTYYATGSQQDVAAAQYWGFGGLAALAVGGLALAAGAIWQVLAGNDEAGGAP